MPIIQHKDSLRLIDLLITQLTEKKTINTEYSAYLSYQTGVYTYTVTDKIKA